jgi:uncharacterized protein YqgC (DUF456 family)
MHISIADAVEIFPHFAKRQNRFVISVARRDSHPLPLHCRSLIAARPMTTQFILYALAAALILVGLAGTILPALPGVPLVFAGMLVAAWAGDFLQIGWPTLTILGILTALAVLIDFIAGLVGAKRVGASGWALLGAALGTIVGMFVGGIFGLIFGPFVGAVAGELIAGSTLKRSTVVGVGAWLGFLFGTIAKIALCFTMLGVFALAYVF